MPEFPDVELDWRPCEAHPRPEEYSRHSDLCARGMYFASEFGIDAHVYHKMMYQAAIHERDKVDVDDPAAIAGVFGGLCDGGAFAECLKGGKFADTLDENNRLVWDVYDCPAVPSYRISGSGALLKSVPGVGVTKDMLRDFIKEGLGK